MHAPAGDTRAPVSLVPSGLPVRRLEISLNHWVKNSISLEEAFLKTVFSDCVSLNLFPVVSLPLGHRSLCVEGKYSPWSPQDDQGGITEGTVSRGTDPSSLVQLGDGVATGSSRARTESLPASVGRRGHSAARGSLPVALAICTRVATGPTPTAFSSPNTNITEGVHHLNAVFKVFGILPNEEAQNSQRN